MVSLIRREDSLMASAKGVEAKGSEEENDRLLGRKNYECGHDLHRPVCLGLYQIRSHGLERDRQTQVPGSCNQFYQI